MSTIFTTAEQAANCRTLADFLESNPRVAGHYNQNIYFEYEGTDCGSNGCALGWAGAAKLCGMHLDACATPVHPGLYSNDPATMADAVFGDGAWNRIFTPVRFDSYETGEAQRQVSIELLRNQAALLETQPELA